MFGNSNTNSKTGTLIAIDGVDGTGKQQLQTSHLDASDKRVSPGLSKFLPGDRF